jgi:hypothetical protein
MKVMWHYMPSYSWHVLTQAIEMQYALEKEIVKIPEVQPFLPKWVQLKLRLILFHQTLQIILSY